MSDNQAVQTLGPDEFTAIVKWAKEQMTGQRTEKYKIARNYYEGDQELAFATVKFTNTFGNLFKTFVYNRCGPLVDAIADRLQLTGFDPVVQGDGEAKALKDEIDRVFRLNRLDRRQNDQILESLKCGDAYAIVWLDGIAPDGKPYPTISINMADAVVIRYNEDTKAKEYAVKAWKRADGFWRLNVYTPTALYKFVTNSKKDDFPDYSNLIQYEAVSIDGIAEPWPLPNDSGQVPVFHFNNNAPEGEFGRSELRDVIPLQDALNKACMDMMVAMEYGAFPQRWATGLGLGMPDPITGKIPSPFNPGAGEVWTGPNGANFGTFEVANLDQFLKVQDGFDAKISNVSRVPEHWLKTGVSASLSGETLKTAEAPFVAKLEDKQIVFGNGWEDVGSYCLNLLGRQAVTLNAVWKPAELRSDTDKLQEGILKKQLGWSEDQIQRDFGLEQSQIDRMKQENLDKMAAAQAAIGAGMQPANPDKQDGDMPPLRKASPNVQDEQQT